MSALVTADLHCGDNPRDGYRLAFLKKLPMMARQRQVDQIIILGDLTEEKDRHGAWLVNQIVEIIYQLAQVAFVIVLQGNHDYVSIDSPFFGFLGRLSRVTFITKPEVMQLGRLGSCLLLPHTRNPDRDWKGLKMSGHHTIFAHNTFSGANVGHGRIMDGIDPNIFPKGANVVSGDVHVPQQFGCVTYVGAPYLVDFGDEYTPRMLLLEQRKTTSIRCAGPQKRLIECVAGQHLEKWTGIADGDIVKVRVTIMQKHVERWEEIKSDIQAWGERHKLIMYSIVPVLAGSTEAGTPLRIGRASAPKDDKQIVKEFAQHRDVDDRTVKTGLFIMDKTK